MKSSPPQKKPKNSQPLALGLKLEYGPGPSQAEHLIKEDFSFLNLLMRFISELIKQLPAHVLCKCSNIMNKHKLLKSLQLYMRKQKYCPSDNLMHYPYQGQDVKT